VIRLGIVGTNYGRSVQLPAFRADPRCQVVAFAGRDAARTRELVRAAGVAKGYGDWRALVDDSDVQAVAIATLPSVQVQVAQAALALGKPVFIEKPMANDLSAARIGRRRRRIGLPQSGRRQAATRESPCRRYRAVRTFDFGQCDILGFNESCLDKRLGILLKTGRMGRVK